MVAEIQMDKGILELQNDIVNGKSKDKLIVHSLEASRGKTTESRNTMIKEHEINSSNRHVFVSKFKDELILIAEEINKKVDTAKVYLPPTTENKELIEQYNFCSSNFNECCNAGVLLITHATFMNICNGLKVDESGNDFWDKVKKTNFNKLIIDEQIDNVNDSFFVFSLDRYEEISSILRSLNEIAYFCFTAISKPFVSLIHKRQSNIESGLIDKKYKFQLHRVNLDEWEAFEKNEHLKKQINYLKEEFFIDEQFIKDLKRNEKSFLTNEKLKEFVAGIEQLYKEIELNNVLIDYSSLYCYDSEFEFKMLDNNVWLDASAKFHSLYKLSDKFIVRDSERIIDHGDSTLHIYYENTSTYHKRTTGLTKFRSEKTKFIKKEASEESRILIISNKSECEALSTDFIGIDEEFLNKFKEIKFTNFQDMRGKNNWETFDYCFIIQTPRLPFAYYVFLYEYWSKAKLADDDIFMANGSNKEYRFNHEELTYLMEMEMTSCSYQSLKRISRSRKPKGEYYIFCNLNNINDTLIDQFYNINIDVDGKKEFLKDKFINLMNEIRLGEYSNERIELDNKNPKVITKKNSNYLNVIKSWVYEKLNVSADVFRKDIKNKIDEKELGVKIDKKFITINVNKSINC